MKISIITASYNYENYIKETIESVLAQSYQDWEMIIVDDGSCDNSVAVINEYCQKDCRIKLFQHQNNENMGLAETLKLGLKHSQSEWIVFLESDDLITPDYLEKKLSIINKHPDVDFVFNDVEMFGNEQVIADYVGYFAKQRGILHKLQFPCKLHKKSKNIYLNLIPTFSCVMAKKSLFKKLDFDSPIMQTLDLYLWSQLMKTTQFYYMSEKLTQWRMHSKSYINSQKPDNVRDFLFRYKLTTFIYSYSNILRIPLLIFKYLRRNVFWLKKIDGKYKLLIFNKRVLKNLNSLFLRVSSDKRHNIINLLGVKINIKRKFNLNAIYKQYSFIEKRIKKIAKNEKLNITFMVSVGSMFPAKPLADYLIFNQKENYNVTFLVVPDFRFGSEAVKKIQEQCYEELVQNYGVDRVVKIPISAKEDKINLRDFTDIMFFSLPYDVSHPKYALLNIIYLGILPAMVNYGFFRSLYDRKLIKTQEYSLYWKIFVETKYNLSEFIEYQSIKGKNCVLTGYCKMDAYAKKKLSSEKTQKCIMIAPHHSVQGGYNDTLSLSNFYKYSEFFLELPKLYPEINFIFRPHPALFLCLASGKLWGREKVDSYIAEMKSNSNVIYSDGGDYFNEFAQSDGIIQDCGSYLVEYFYTGKPQCYMLKSEKDINNKFVELGKKCLQHSYIAYEKQHILDFIDKVIVEEKDYKKDARDIFAKSEVMINYPNVSEKICEHFNNLFGVKK